MTTAETVEIYAFMPDYTASHPTTH